MAHELGFVATGWKVILSKKHTSEHPSNRISTYQRNAFYIDRGVNLLVVNGSCNKMKEVSYVQTRRLPAGETKHGTIWL